MQKEESDFTLIWFVVASIDLRCPCFLSHVHPKVKLHIYIDFDSNYLIVHKVHTNKQYQSLLA